MTITMLPPPSTMSLPDVCDLLSCSRPTALRLARELAARTPPEARLVRRGVKGRAWQIDRRSVEAIIAEIV